MILASFSRMFIADGKKENPVIRLHLRKAGFWLLFASPLTSSPVSRLIKNRVLAMQTHFRNQISVTVPKCLHSNQSVALNLPTTGILEYTWSILPWDFLSSLRALDLVHLGAPECRKKQSLFVRFLAVVKKNLKPCYLNCIYVNKVLGMPSLSRTNVSCTVGDYWGNDFWIYELCRGHIFLPYFLAI